MRTCRRAFGKNLYSRGSRNVDFFGRLFGHAHAEREAKIDELLRATGLAHFRERPAGKLSRGMRQKLSLCCALIHDPELLVLDEPTTGVDLLSRRQCWELVDRIRERRPVMTVVVSTACMEEADVFGWLATMNTGRVLATGSPAELMERTGRQALDAAFIELLREEARRGQLVGQVLFGNLSMRALAKELGFLERSDPHADVVEVRLATGRPVDRVRGSAFTAARLRGLTSRALLPRGR